MRLRIQSDGVNDDMVNKQQVKEVFQSYVSDFDAGDAMIQLKIDHTKRVAELCEQIAKSLELTAEECELAWLLGMLHDLGRFVQIREYGTFNDLVSINHALGSIRVLFEDGYMRRFLECDCYDEIIDTAIRHHNAFRLPEGLDEKTKLFCDILRDADKVDIMRLDTELPREDIYGDDIEQCRYEAVTGAVFDEFMGRSAILRSNIVNHIDRIVGHASLAFELVFPLSRRIVYQKGYIDQIFDIGSENKCAQEQISLMRTKVKNYILE